MKWVLTASHPEPSPRSHRHTHPLIETAMQLTKDIISYRELNCRTMFGAAASESIGMASLLDAPPFPAKDTQRQSEEKNNMSHPQRTGGHTSVSKRIAGVNDGIVQFHFHMLICTNLFPLRFILGCELLNPNGRGRLKLGKFLPMGHLPYKSRNVKYKDMSQTTLLQTKSASFRNCVDK
jgi:hypothetical protein